MLIPRTRLFPSTVFYVYLTAEFKPIDTGNGSITPALACEPVVLVALNQQTSASIKEMENYLGEFKWSSSGFRNACKRLEKWGLVEKTLGRPFRYTLTEKGKLYISEAVDKVCDKLGLGIGLSDEQSFERLAKSEGLSV